MSNRSSGRIVRYLVVGMASLLAALIGFAFTRSVLVGDRLCAEVALCDVHGNLVLADLDTQTTVTLHGVGCARQWAPSTRFLTAVDRRAAWVVDVCSHSSWPVPVELDRSGEISWSPSEEQLAMWGRSGDSTTMHVCSVASQTCLSLRGTEGYDCNLGRPAWSSDGQWVMFMAGRCQEEDWRELFVEGDILAARADGTGAVSIVTVVGDRNRATIVPSPASNEFAISLSDWSAEDQVVYLLSLDSPATRRRVVHHGRSYLWLEWASDGSVLYAGRQEEQGLTVDCIDPRTSEATQLWSGLELDGRPYRSRTGPTIAFVEKSSVRVLDLRDGRVTQWADGLSRVCGLVWAADDSLSAVVVCEQLGRMVSTSSRYRVVVVRGDGSRTTIGHGLYGWASTPHGDAW